MKKPDYWEKRQWVKRAIALSNERAAAADKRSQPRQTEAETADSLSKYGL